MATDVEVLPESSGPGSVVLDIGGSIGAAVVYLPASLGGREIEIRNTEDQWAGIHVAVLERALPTTTAWAAVFPSLLEGRYEIRERGRAEAPTNTFEVTGGQVISVTFDG